METANFLDYYSASQTVPGTFDGDQVVTDPEQPVWADPQQASAHLCPGDEPEVLEFLTLLHKHGGSIKIGDKGFSLGLHFRDSLSVDNHPARSRLAVLLSTNETLSLLLPLLPDGCFDGVYLAWFAGRRPQKGAGWHLDKSEGEA